MKYEVHIEFSEEEKALFPSEILKYFVDDILEVLSHASERVSERVELYKYWGGDKH